MYVFKIIKLDVQIRPVFADLVTFCHIATYISSYMRRLISMCTYVRMCTYICMCIEYTIRSIT